MLKKDESNSLANCEFYKLIIKIHIRNLSKSLYFFRLSNMIRIFEFFWSLSGSLRAAKLLLYVILRTECNLLLKDSLGKW